MSNTTDPAGLTALDAVRARDMIAHGELSAERLTEACLQRIAARDGEIRAWAAVDPELARRQARAADAWRQSGRPLGALHGLPVGVKDIIDTADLPTENGSALDRGRRPQCDAALVTRLRAAGAVVLGKTATTECAHLAPAATRNPLDTGRTPGGSSSGSAAAVADGMVPLAVGTQTGGSVIRPAAYCGVIGYKPSFGTIPRSGVLMQAPQLDTIGVFSRTLEDAALLTDALAGHDPGDPDSRLEAPPDLLTLARSDPPATPALAFVPTAAWELVDADTAAGFEELLDTLGDRCDRIDLPEAFAEAAAAQRRLALSGIARNLRHYYDRGADRIRPETREAIEQGRGISAVDYLSALDWREVLGAGLEEIFQRYDMLITPATTGEAPGPETTGNPACCVLWTLTGVPAVTVPLLQGAGGLPIGVQLIGRRGYDGRLLRSARWLLRQTEQLTAD